MGKLKLNLQQRRCDKPKCSFFLPSNCSDDNDDDDDDNDDDDDDDDDNSPRTDQYSILLGHVTLCQRVIESRRCGTT